MRCRRIVECTTGSAKDMLSRWLIGFRRALLRLANSPHASRVDLRHEKGVTVCADCYPRRDTGGHGPRTVTPNVCMRVAYRSHRTVLIAPFSSQPSSLSHLRSAIFAQPSSLCDRMTGESVTASALEKAASTLSDTVTDDQSRHEFSSQPSSLCGRMTGESVTASAQPAQAIIPASMHYRHPAAIKT